MSKRTPKTPSIKSLPKCVEAVFNFILSDPDHKFFRVASKLMPCDAFSGKYEDVLDGEQLALTDMWTTLEKHERVRIRRINHLYPEDADNWVYIFLERVAGASDFPPFYDKSTADRLELSNSISKLSRALSRLLIANKLDCHLVHVNGAILNGIEVYEDFVEKNQERINLKGNKKIKFSEVLKHISDRAIQKISEVSTNGNAGPNVAAIRFARIIDWYNVEWYEKPLYSVTATATNALYGTKYCEADIYALVTHKS